MKKQFSSWLAAASAATFIFSSATQASAAPMDITIATGPSGGTFEVVAAASVEILQKKFPEFRFGIIPGGSTGNVAVLGTGKAQLSMVTADSAYAGWNGLAPFKQKYQDMRGMFVVYPNTLQIWTPANSSIKSFADLKGKKFTCGQPGSGPYQVGLELLKVYGMSKDDLQVLPYSWGEAVNTLRDSNIDAVLWTTSFPAPAIVDATTTRDIRLLQQDPKKLDAFREKFPTWVDVTIPAGTYKGQATDVKTIGTIIFFAVDKALPDDVVYKMTKALYESRADLAQTHAILKYIGKETVAKGMGIPLHPGAEKFFKEVGILTK